MAQPRVENPLEPLYEGWQRGLAIVAHPDDLECGAAAATARWTGQGKQIVCCLVTSGEAGIEYGVPLRRALACAVGMLYNVGLTSWTHTQGRATMTTYVYAGAADWGGKDPAKCNR